MSIPEVHGVARRADVCFSRFSMASILPGKETRVALQLSLICGPWLRHRNRNREDAPRAVVCWCRRVSLPDSLVAMAGINICRRC